MSNFNNNLDMEVMQPGRIARLFTLLQFIVSRRGVTKQVIADNIPDYSGGYVDGSAASKLLDRDLEVLLDNSPITAIRVARHHGGFITVYINTRLAAERAIELEESFYHGKERR